MYDNGYVFPTNKFLKGNNSEDKKIKVFQAASIKFSTQKTGNRLWEQLYKYPVWGIGAYMADFYNRREIGFPIAIYVFLDAPFSRWEKSSFNYQIGFGATFHWKSFNPLTNQYNMSMGAGESCFIDAGLNYRYELAKNIDLAAGFSCTHFSNGALKQPNYGINTIAPKISIKYNFFDRPVFKKQEVPRFSKKNEWLIGVFGGLKNVIYDSVNTDIKEKYEGVFFPVFGVSTVFNRLVSYKSKIGIGLTATYNSSINAQVAVDKNELDIEKSPMRDKFQLCIYPSYELVVHKVSLIIQPAFYIYRKRTKIQTPDFHQRIGLKYYFTDRFFAGITLRDYAFHVSDVIEWNVGYRIK